MNEVVSECAECEAPCGGKACRHEVIDSANMAMAQAGMIGGFYIRPMRLTTGGVHLGHAHWVDHVSNITKPPLRIDWKNLETGERGTVEIREPCKVLIKANVHHSFTALGDVAEWECWFAESHNHADKPVTFHQERPDG